jgi:hypothetical protein
LGVVEQRRGDLVGGGVACQEIGFDAVEVHTCAGVADELDDLGGTAR